MRLRLIVVSLDLDLLICYEVFNYNEAKSSKLKHLCKELSDCDAQKPTQSTV